MLYSTIYFLSNNPIIHTSIIHMGQQFQLLPESPPYIAIPPHEPHVMYIGCCDARYNESCLDLSRGETFKLNTIANSINVNDPAAMSSLEYAVLYLNVKKITIVGHNDCGGIKACLYNDYNNLPKNLKCHLKELNTLCQDYNKMKFSTIDPIKLISIQNIKLQIDKLNSIDFIQSAIEKQKLVLSGMIYNLDTNILEHII
ncbi:hypothetical protein KAFR_0J01430 [Kazachstania africana CBS 2517]|uniref:Carbonic anhydrase n=1 Tax=Kazachstania africana (strain ATCC 22294 / BCRC 22015 / CBS 2517 / CECT 1963 / NBRC 1671 / NRRL Y-8276) TaxID=1071382 RepID=H2B0R0_KAZAF|nr:hypothetical protein KAFR_0J01430 [Kazachstania africana CBS 2517]CCF60210.1 hypothetical protein KAFR_0J01430 [Kazachstania africana CBS 2517]